MTQMVSMLKNLYLLCTKVFCWNMCRKSTNEHPFNGPFSGTTQVSQKGKTTLDFTEARDSEWQWHQLGHMQVCISLQTDNHASTPPLSFLQAGCPSCHPTNSVKALKAFNYVSMHGLIICVQVCGLFVKQNYKSVSFCFLT